MSLDLLPSFFVPLVGLVLPLFSIIALFLYIEKENREVFDPTTYKF
jgi:photosystem I reaction center subunit VIII|uniref:Photosystem I reaction center subunit VIII n=2 Tax=Monodopsidaceae TaxID=425072 RepID=T1RH13_9STRA|nr:photosystem I subunit VIII [Microchloropsis salina]AGI98707.1 photosystem I subunit VIII [Nannochloropsis gaditana]AGI99207.1 photosystem I subunit VIII [Microchloropsis salina]AHX25106.1 photosystem I reaction center subunit VIII [Nannochloropsis gaditana]AHX25507.1 photosystem I reaction center subunit VIII [Microchloropsis salina]